MGFTSAWHWIIVLAIVVILFGAGQIPRVMGDVAKGIKNFKAGEGRRDDARCHLEQRPEGGLTPSGRARPARPVDASLLLQVVDDVDHHDCAEHGGDQSADEPAGTEADQPQHGAADEAAHQAKEDIADDRATADLNWLRLHDVASEPAGDAGHHQS